MTASSHALPNESPVVGGERRVLWGPSRRPGDDALERPAKRLQPRRHEACVVGPPGRLAGSKHHDLLLAHVALVEAVRAPEPRGGGHPLAGGDGMANRVRSTSVGQGRGMEDERAASRGFVLRSRKSSRQHRGDGDVGIRGLHDGREARLAGDRLAPGPERLRLRIAARVDVDPHETLSARSIRRAIHRITGTAMLFPITR